MGTTNIVIADDHHIVRQGIKVLLENEPGFVVVGEASDGQKAVEITLRLKPNILVVDVLMPSLSGLEVTRRVTKACPKIRVIVLTSYEDEPYVIEALRSGAYAYVLKKSSITDLICAVHEVNAGRHYLGPPLSEPAIEAYLEKTRNLSLDSYDTLTMREREVLHLAIDGHVELEDDPKVPGQREAIVAHLKQDEIKNLNMLYFMQFYPITTLEQVGASVLLQGKSDRKWVYIGSSKRQELELIRDRLTEEDRNFAAIKEWIVPVITKGRELVWSLSMTRLVLPDHTTLSGLYQPRNPVTPLSINDVQQIYNNSLHKAVTTPRYLQERIRKGPSAGIVRSGRLVAWAMTHDDFSIGVMHVLEAHRGRGYALDLTAHLIKAVRERGYRPFVHIEATNTPSINLASRLGFRKDRKLRWFETK